MSWIGLATAVIGLILEILRRRNGSYLTRRAQAADDLKQEAQRRAERSIEAIEARDLDAVVKRIDDTLDSIDFVGRVRSEKEGDSH